MSAPIEWDECQQRANEVLCQGIWKLQGQMCCHANETSIRCCGNYLISLDDKPRYIGEASDLCARLRQQFKIKISTFYKTYLKRNENAEIRTFSVKTIETSIGRKEIEEFGITNIPCDLNRFQLGKRTKHVLATGAAVWETVQLYRDQLLSSGSERAMAASQERGDKASPPPQPGIYIIRTDAMERPLYIGESSDLAERWHDAHRKSTYFSALRRHVATDVLGFSLKVRNGKAKHLESTEESAVSAFLNEARCAFFPVQFGRYELEEHLIRKYAPVLNRKANKN